MSLGHLPHVFTPLFNGRFFSLVVGRRNLECSSLHPNEVYPTHPPRTASDGSSPPQSKRDAYGLSSPSHSKGFTVLEIVISLAIIGILAASLAGIISLVLSQVPKQSAKLAIETRHQLARYWIVRDANSAENFTPGTSPDYGTFTWRDFTLTGPAATPTPTPTPTPVPTATPTPVPHLQFASGSYSGNGTDNRSITGVGFQPDILIVKGNTTQVAVMRTSTMTGDVTKPLSGATALTANMIQSLDADGFNIGTNATVNTNGVTYYWMAFKAAQGELKVGSYSGNGTSQSITGVGFQPEYVVAMAATAVAAVQRSSTMSSSYLFSADTGAADRVTSFNADGFSVGASAQANSSGVTYHYVAWNVVAGMTNVGSYLGSGVDNRNITGMGFQPEYVIDRGAASVETGHKSAATGSATDTAMYFTNLANATNMLQALQTDGFQVGTAAQVNTSGTTYHWVGFGNPPPTPTPTPTPVPTPTPTPIPSSTMSTYQVRYYYDQTLKALMREEQKDGVVQSSFQVAGDILQQGDVAFAWDQGQRKVTVTIIPTIQEALAIGDVTRTATLVEFLRFKGQQPVPAPADIAIPTPVPGSAIYFVAADPTLLTGSLVSGNSLSLLDIDSNYYVVDGSSKVVSFEVYSQTMNSPSPISQIEVRYTGQADKNNVSVNFFVKDASGYPSVADSGFTFTVTDTDNTRYFYLNPSQLSFVNTTKVVFLKVEAGASATFRLSSNQILFIASP